MGSGGGLMEFGFVNDTPVEIDEDQGFVCVHGVNHPVFSEEEGKQNERNERNVVRIWMVSVEGSCSGMSRRSRFGGEGLDICSSQNVSYGASCGRRRDILH